MGPGSRDNSMYVAPMTDNPAGSSRPNPYENFNAEYDRMSTSVAGKSPSIGSQTIYDKDSLESLVNALRRVGIFDLALPPEIMRPNPNIEYALPNAGSSQVYSTNDIMF